LPTSSSYVLFEGDVILFVQDGVIMLKTCDSHNDPVELNDEQAATLGNLLLKLAAENR
jgi:hypothetical protein